MSTHRNDLPNGFLRTESVGESAMFGHGALGDVHVGGIHDHGVLGDEPVVGVVTPSRPRSSRTRARTAATSITASAEAIST